MLERDRVRQSERRSAQQYSESQLPLLQQQRVVHKLASFHEKVGDCQFHSCNTCHEFFPSLKVSSSSGECSRCSRDQHQPKLYSHENCTNPGPMPAELQDLTQVEELLISAVMPMMILYRLPHGQLGYSGHIVNLPQDVFFCI